MPLARPPQSRPLKPRRYHPKIDTVERWELQDINGVLEHMLVVLADWDAYSINDPRANPDNTKDFNDDYMELADIKEQIKKRLLRPSGLSTEDTLELVRQWNATLKGLVGKKTEAGFRDAQAARASLEGVLQPGHAQAVLDLACYIRNQCTIYWQHIEERKIPADNVRASLQTVADSIPKQGVGKSPAV